MILYREVEPEDLEVAKQSFCPEDEFSAGPDLQAEVTIRYAGGERYRAYILIELLKRRDFMGCAPRKTRPPTRWVLEVGARVEAALAHARQREIVHREMTLCGMVCTRRPVRPSCDVLSTVHEHTPSTGRPCPTHVQGYPRADRGRGPAQPRHTRIACVHHRPPSSHASEQALCFRGSLPATGGLGVSL